MTDMRRLLRVTQAAERLGVTAATIRVWITNGALPGVRPGRTIFVPIYAIEAIERGEMARPSTSEPRANAA
jgi:excisionase family DNA binding protein